ncbi:MAG: PD40 domain-containing protein [Bacteroidetes bacterium]|nr:PD40 domain-containing protein [Bacteroidota bacterium]
MKQKPLLPFILLCFLFQSVTAQITNTRKWRKTENDSMQAAFLMFDEQRFAMALPIYQDLFLHHPKEEYLKYCYGKCALYRSDKHDTALVLLSEIYEKNKKAENIEYDLARAMHYNYKFDEAIALLDKFIARKKIDPEIRSAAGQLRHYCLSGKELYSKPTGANITNIGNVINTENDEYVPVISADESVMIFTYRGKESTGGLQNDFMQPDPHGSYFEDVFQSLKENETWTKPTGIKSINTNEHDAAIAMSSDGQQLFIYKDNGDDHGDIYVSTLIGNDWSAPVKLKGLVNSYSWEGSCSLTADGRYLYFSSERGGGYGGKDIYRATLLADSTWGNIVNLGDSINTPFDDDAPYMHPDGITLFYSSKGKNSMGGYDIFQAKMNVFDSTFSQPVNLGYPINTPDDDIYYVLSADGKRGYYASGKKGGFGLKDIYLVDPGYVGKKPAAFLVKGKITENSNAAEAAIHVEITNKNNKSFGTYHSNAGNGNYLISLPAEGEYKITYQYKTYSTRTLTVSTIGLSDFTEKIFNVDFSAQVDTAKPVVVAEPVKKDTVVAVVKTPTLAVVKHTEPVKTEPVKETTPREFVPNNVFQQKIMDYAKKYGTISAEGLIFKVQIAAYKYPKNYTYAHLKGLGNVENLLLDDGITRITIGGSFNTLGEAFEHNKKVVWAGQKDAFVTALYKGKRVYLEQLEEMGIFK